MFTEFFILFYFCYQLNTNLEQDRLCHEEQCCYGLFNVEIIALFQTHLSVFLRKICSASISLLCLLRFLTPGFSFNSSTPKACVSAEAFSSHAEVFYYNLCCFVSLTHGRQAAPTFALPVLERGKNRRDRREGKSIPHSPSPLCPGLVL